MGETIDPKTSSRTPRVSAWMALVGASAIAIVVAVVLVRGGSGDDTLPVGGRASTVATGSGSELSTLDTSPPKMSEATTAEVVPTSKPVGTSPAATVSPTSLLIAPVDAPSAEQADISLGGFLDRIPAVINPVVQSGSEPPTSAVDEFPDLSAVATGAVLDELRATADEFDEMGWTQKGVPVIVELRVTQPPSPTSPTDAVVEVCLDNTNARVLDKEGKDVRPPDTPKRSLNIYVLRLVGDAWLVAEHSFPDDPNC